MALSKKLVLLRLWQPTLTLSSTDMRSNRRPRLEGATDADMGNVGGAGG
jgi:hypothetical protein